MLPLKNLTIIAKLFFLCLSSKVFANGYAKSYKVEEIQYGTSLAGRKLVAYKLSEPKLDSRFAVMITGGVHGNEYMGLVAQFPHEFSKMKSVKAYMNMGGVVYFVPKINPDGVMEGSRANGEGLDLNRTFLKEYLSSKRESAELSKWFEREVNDKGLKLVMAMDYHCCNGSLIYPEIAPDRPSVKKVFYEQSFSKMAELMKAEVNKSYRTGVTKKMFGYETRGTLKDYWFHKYGTLSFTFEGISPREEAKNLPGHLNWWNKIFAELSSITQDHIAYISPEWATMPTEENVRRSVHSE